MKKKEVKITFSGWLARIALLLILCLCACTGFTQTYPFQDPDKSLETRVSDLLSRLTIDEKISLLHQWQPEIPRLGVDSFRTGTEGLHGIAWLGTATVFPQAIGIGSTWDRELARETGSAVGDEGRAKHALDPNNAGLSIWSPVVDLLRDPRAGRTEEGYSEDPYLTGQMSLAYCRGLKGDDPFYYKTIPTLKHFYAYNQEEDRDTTNVTINDRNKHEYYLEAFRYAIEAGAAKSMMTAYNLVNGIPCTVHPDINTIVKAQWVPDDFFVVTDAYAPSNLTGSQGYYPDNAQAHAEMIKAGVDSMTQDGEDPASTINHINNALSRGLISESDIDNAVRNILRVRFHTGEFDGSRDSYGAIGSSEINHPDHQALARKAVRKSVVLLKNENNLLPLDRNSINTIAVIGQRANQVLTDWYSGDLPYAITPLDGILDKAGSTVTVTYSPDNAGIARSADAAIVILGNHPTCNGGWGSGCPVPSEGKETYDRSSINLEPGDLNLLQQTYNANQNTIFVLIASFPYAITWPKDNIPAILYLAHGGQELGSGLADVLFGDYNPAGRLTMTWYSSLDQIPSISGYDIIGGNRTYMYFTGTPLYPFGHGLSYTTFEYSNLRLSSSSIDTNSSVTVRVDVKNTGSRTGDEVVQLYVHDTESSVKRPIKELLGFDRVPISPGQTRTVSLTIPAGELAYWDTGRNSFYVEPGFFDIMVGGSSTGIRLTTSLYVSDGDTTPSPGATPTQSPGGTPDPPGQGDVNNDGVVDILDALLVAQFYVGLNPVNFNQDYADVNCNDSIDIVDALVIAQYYVGLVSEFC